MLRRAALAMGLGGAAAAATKGSTVQPQAAETMLSASWAAVGETNLANARPRSMMRVPFENPAVKAAYDVLTHRRQRQKQMCSRLGGAPHIMVMQSNAMWFRIQRSMAWEEAQDENILTLLRDLMVTDDLP